MEEKPKLRPVEVFPIRTDRGTMVCLRDVSGMSDRVVTASPQVVAVLQYFDGRHTVLDIQTDITRRTGSIVQSGDIKRIIAVLDEALMLENGRFEAHRARVTKEFAESPVRPAASAGHSYPDDANELRGFLDGIVAEADADVAHPPSGVTASSCVAQPPPAGAVSSPSPQARAPVPHQLRGLVAPHIDHRRGEKCYAAAYAALDRTGPADLFILLGTAHAQTSERFVLTRKDFETPLGRAKTDVDAVETLAKAAGRDLFADEFAHRAEHSIELELVFVQRLMEKTKHDFRVVPVLCGGYAEAMEEGKPPAELPGVKGFIDALRGVLGREKGRAVVVAGADLAHVGPRFGTPEKVTPALLRDLEAADRVSLSFVEKGDADGFLGHVALDGNARNVCGVGPIWTALKTLEPCAATLLNYEQWAEEDGSSAVTFAACTIQ